MTNQVTTLTQSNSESVVNFATGKITGDAGTPVAVTLPLGFTPRYVELLCLTSSVAANVLRTIEWFDGMTDGQCRMVTVAAGAPTHALDTTHGPTVLGANPSGNPLNAITFPASAFDATATYVWQAQG